MAEPPEHPVSVPPSGTETVTQPDGSPLHLTDNLTTEPVPLEGRVNTSRKTKARPTDMSAAPSRNASPQRNAFPFRNSTGKSTRGPAPVEGVDVIDHPATRIHHPADLLSLLISVLGILLVLFFAVYAHATTTGITEDVQSAAEPAMANLATALRLPVQFLESFALLLMPLLIIVDLALRRAGRTIIEATIAILSGLGVGWFALYALETWAPHDLQTAFQLLNMGEWVTIISPIPVAVTAMFTVSGRHGGRKTVTWAWNLLWIAVGLSVITGGTTIPAVLVVMLLGRIVGLTIRYISGVQSDRAYGNELVLGVRRTGIDPVRIVRITDLVAGESELPLTPSPDAATRALGQTNGNRIYAVTTATGARVDVLAFDGDRQVASYFTRVWQTVRLQALERRSATSLRQVTERTALLGYSARAAGIHTPEILGVAESADSMFIAQTHPENCLSVRDLPDERLTNELLASIWKQLERAHKARLAHRGLSLDTVLIDDDDQVWLTSWDAGDVASSALARRLDTAQALVMLALRIGVDRAVTSAREFYTDEELAALGPALQPVILPVDAREDAKENKETLDDLRKAVVAGMANNDDIAPVEFKRKWAPTLMVVMSVLAIWILVTTLEFDSIVDAVRNAQPLWLLASFGFVLITYLGAALAFVGFSPVKLPVWKTTLVEVAASFVNFVAPAGVGPAALNLRFLTKREVKTSLAVATVALVQLSGFVVTVMLLLFLVLISGNDDALKLLPSTTIIITILVILAVVGGLMAIPKLRIWALAKIMPTIRQIWPRLVEVLGHPGKLALGLGGNLLITVGYLASFWAAIAAFGFGGSLSAIDVALIYLVGNTIGSLTPTPGGMGGVEAALAVGLVAGGIPKGVAGLIAILFRVVSYWLRIPLGWFATQYLQKRNEI